jgi:cytochrome c peroxidase
LSHAASGARERAVQPTKQDHLTEGLLKYSSLTAAPARRLATLALATLFAAGCNADLNSDEEAELRKLQLIPSDIPASTTNRFAEDPAAAALGQRLFRDKRMSADGDVACASCHDPNLGFSDGNKVSVGAFGKTGQRHSMPTAALAFRSFFFWDGRADSGWSQPLKAIEGGAEMDFSRSEVAHFIDTNYRSDYEAIFGAIPDLASVPARAQPGLPAWDSIPATKQDEVQRVFANVGKSLEAYERKLLCDGTRFDQWAAGTATLTSQERAGAAAFVRGGCIGCHSGPSFSDGAFHALGITTGDRGRAAGIPQLLADPFNGVGPYSDDTAGGARKLATINSETLREGAFRTASLRGVGQRTLLSHAGLSLDLADFIQQVYRRGRGGGGRGRGGDNDNGVTTQDPLLRAVDVEDADAIATFLRTLDCPTPSDALIAP